MEGPKTFRMRVAIPVRAVLGIALGFGTGFTVGSVQHHREAEAAKAAPVGQPAAPAAHAARH